MALRRIARVPLSADGRYVIVRMKRSDLDRLEKHLFQRYPNREWGTFFRFGFRRTPWGIAVSFVDGLWPEPGDLDRQSDITVFRAQYSLRAFRSAGNRQLAIGVVHSHPSGFRTSPSPLDDDMDAYFARETTAYSGGFPYTSLIFQRDDARGFTFSGRVYDRGEWLPVQTLFTIGAVIEKETSELRRDGEPFRFVADRDTESTTARSDELFGLAGAQRLNQAIVGIIGCSGTGSPSAHVLARARVGGFVLVDPQRAAKSNLERMHGLFHDDLSTDSPPFKVELLHRMIRAINPDVNVTTLVGNVLQENVLDELLRCDALLGCTDSVHGRVFLSDIAKHYLLPSLDTGVEMDGQNGRLSTQLADLTRYSPELACAFCNGLIDTSAMTEELMTDEERSARRRAAEEASARGDDPSHYWRHRRQLHTVGYMTTAVGAIAAGYVEGWLTGAFEMPHAAFQFDLGHERLGVVPSTPRNRVCTCHERIGWADQARSYRNVARPRHWPARALLLARDDTPSNSHATPHGNRAAQA